MGHQPSAPLSTAEITKNKISSSGYWKWPLVVLRGSGKELKDVWKTELLSLRGFELRIFFHVTHFDESKIQYHCPCSKYFTIILLSENFLKAISLGSDGAQSDFSVLVHIPIAMKESTQAWRTTKTPQLKISFEVASHLFTRWFTFRLLFCWSLNNWIGPISMGRGFIGSIRLRYLYVQSNWTSVDRVTPAPPSIFETVFMWSPERRTASSWVKLFLTLTLWRNCPIWLSRAGPFFGTFVFLVVRIDSEPGRLYTLDRTFWHLNLSKKFRNLNNFRLLVLKVN